MPSPFQPRATTIPMPFATSSLAIIQLTIVFPTCLLNQLLPPRKDGMTYEEQTMEKGPRLAQMVRIRSCIMRSRIGIGSTRCVSVGVNTNVSFQLPTFLHSSNNKSHQSTMKLPNGATALHRLSRLMITKASFLVTLALASTRSIPHNNSRH